ncbi:MAG: response regulator, partial [Telluria sp.]
MSARILIIEDNPTNMELMVYLLNAFGFTPLSANDGVCGVQAARDTNPDLIICDVNLPRLDGYGVVTALKQDPELRHIPVLAVTALAMVGDRERLLAAGFDGYIAKPIEPDTFVVQLEQFLAPRRAAEAPVAAAGPARARQATILIVDDHVLNREFLLTLLGYGGHRLLDAASGPEALRLIKEEKPDLVISDILMPGMDGYELVRRLRRDPDTASLPVIFYTALYRDREAGRLAQDCGVRWLLPKPSAPDVILRTVHEALGIGQGGQQAADDGQPGFLVDDAVADYFDEVDAGHDPTAPAPVQADGDAPDAQAARLQMTQRLSTSLSSLQAVSLRLTALIELGIELGAEREPGALIENGCRVAHGICASRYACIGMLEDGMDTLQYFASCGEGGEARVVRNAPRAGVLGKLLGQHVPVRVSGIGGDPSVLGLPKGHPQVHSFLGVPIISRERVHGWLYLVDKLDAAEFSEVDERVAVTVSAQIAAAYENLALYEEIKRHHAQLTADMEVRIRLDEDLRRFRTAMDATGDAIFLIDRAITSFVDVNATACRMLGFERQEFLGCNAPALHVEVRSRLRGLLGKLEGGEHAEAMAELIVERRDGSTVSVEVQRRTLRSGSNWILVAVARDITERKHA